MFGLVGELHTVQRRNIRHDSISNETPAERRARNLRQVQINRRVSSVSSNSKRPNKSLVARSNTIKIEAKKSQVIEDMAPVIDDYTDFGQCQNADSVSQEETADTWQHSSGNSNSREMEGVLINQQTDFKPDCSTKTKTNTKNNQVTIARTNSTFQRKFLRNRVDPDALARSKKYKNSTLFPFLIKNSKFRKKLNAFFLYFTPFQRQKVNSIEDFLSFKHRRKLVNERKSYCAYATTLNVLGVLLTLGMAEKQVQDGLCMNDRDCMPLDRAQCILPSNLTHENAYLENTTEIIDYWSNCLECSYDPGIFVKIICIFLSMTTIGLLYFTLLYHKIEYAVFKFDNSIAPDLAYINADKLFKLLVEMAILSVHPIGYLKCVNFYSFPGLYFWLLLRFMYVDRFFILQSAMYSNTTTETVATLNQINFGALTKESKRLIFRNYMCQYPGKIMITFVGMNWLMMAWCIRLSEAREDLRNGMMLSNYDSCVYNMKDTLWHFPITFTTIGYGDVVPKSTYGRMFSLWTGISGILASAVLVGLTTDKLTMTRRERMINRVLYNENLRIGG